MSNASREAHQIQKKTAAWVQQAADSSATRTERHEAFRYLVARYEDHAFAYAFTRLGNYELAEDATQEAFITAYQMLAHLRVPNAFPAWLRRIVRTQCQRIQRRHASAYEALPLEDVIVATPPEEDPEQIALRRDQAACVRGALRRLPPRERAVVILFYLGGHSRSEVAVLLGVSPVAVKKRLASARARLKEGLLEMVGDDLTEHRPSRNETFQTRLLGFHKLFSALIEGGSSLAQALNKLAQEERDERFRAAIEGVNQSLQSGNTMSAAMRLYPDFFPTSYIEAIREGEVKGALDIVLDQIAEGRYTPGGITAAALDAAAAWRFAYKSAQEQG